MALRFRLVSVVLQPRPSLPSSLAAQPCWTLLLPFSPSSARSTDLQLHGPRTWSSSFSPCERFRGAARRSSLLAQGLHWHRVQREGRDARKQSSSSSREASTGRQRIKRREEKEVELRRFLVSSILLPRFLWHVLARSGARRSDLEEIQTGCMTSSFLKNKNRRKVSGRGKDFDSSLFPFSSSLFREPTAVHFWRAKMRYGSHIRIELEADSRASHLASDRARFLEVGFKKLKLDLPSLLPPSSSSSFVSNLVCFQAFPTVRISRTEDRPRGPRGIKARLGLQPPRYPVSPFTPVLHLLCSSSHPSSPSSFVSVFSEPPPDRWSLPSTAIFLRISTTLPPSSLLPPSRRVPMVSQEVAYAFFFLHVSHSAILFNFSVLISSASEANMRVPFPLPFFLLSSSLSSSPPSFFSPSSAMELPSETPQSYPFSSSSESSPQSSSTSPSSKREEDSSERSTSTPPSASLKQEEQLVFKACRQQECLRWS